MQYFVNEKVNFEGITEKHIIQVICLDVDFSTETTKIFKKFFIFHKCYSFKSAARRDNTPKERTISCLIH